MSTDSQYMDCACLIHSNGYDWTYVDRLYKMLQNNSTRQIRLHVYTELDRPVPEPMIKHVLKEWPGIGGPKKSWWYKMQLFNPEYHRGPLVYFDLDVVIARNIDWIWDHDLSYFCTVHDFKYLWRPNWDGINSSMMFWDTEKWANIWQDFQTLDLQAVLRRYHGDQDYLNTAIPKDKRQFFNKEKVKSWRWQIKDGGIDTQTRQYRRPNAGSVLDLRTSVMIFHGSPNPHQVQDPLISRYWHDL